MKIKRRDDARDGEPHERVREVRAGAPSVFSVSSNKRRERREPSAITTVSSNIRQQRQSSAIITISKR